MRVEEPPDRPLFVWDGECAFCGWWVRRWRSRLPASAARAAPYREVAGRFPEIPESSFRRSAKLVLPDGRVLEGAAAVVRLLALGEGGLGWRLYRLLPPFRWAAEAVYRAVARHRGAMGRVTGWLWGGDPRPSTHAVGGWLFRTGLGLIYVVAFLSLLVQVAGLAGPEGILPAGAYLEAVREGTGSLAEAVWRAPTLAWLASGGLALELGAATGAGAGLLLAMGVRPLLSGAAAWVLYLSLTVAGQQFMAYQWDSLLLEAGFLAMFVVPAGSPPEGTPARPDARPGAGGRWLRRLRAAAFRGARPGRPAVWLGAWLLLRLVLESGLAKLAGGDPTWWNLTALVHHFETQPIPNPVAWFAHQLPAWVDRLGTAGTLLVEVPVPLLLLLPRRPRHLGAGLIVVLQLLILLTGNYAFFNLLTVALALLVVDDGLWTRLLGRTSAGRSLLSRLADGEGRARGGGDAGGSDGVRDRLADVGAARGRIRGVLLVPYALLAVTVGGAQLVRTARPGPLPAPVAAAAEAVAPLRLVNGYGLFADMTTARPEIVLQGRRGDGPWRSYDFAYKPDDPGEMPPQVAPHQPRVDWQMWFAALRAARAPEDAPARARYDRWLLRFVSELLRGSADVTGLLADDSPFRRRPPAAVRARLVEYRFTGWETWRRTGRWWHRGPGETYLPPVRLSPRGLVPAR